MSLHGHFCSIFAITYFWVVAAILFVQGAIAVNRWAIVCTQKYRYSCKTSTGTSVSEVLLSEKYTGDIALLLEKEM